jgi:hypothetical protein
MLKTASPEPTQNLTTTATPTKLAAPGSPGGSPGVADAAQAGVGDNATAPAPAEQVKKPEEDLSARFAALSRKEKKLLDTERAMKEREAKLGPIAEAIEKKDVLGLLSLGALSMDDVLQAALKQGEKPSPEDKIQTLEEKIAAWEKTEADKKAADAEREKQKHYDEEVNAFQKTLTEQLQANPEQYEFIHALGAQDQVFSAIHEIVLANPDAYPERKDVEALIPQVAEAIEASLLDQAKKFSAAKKVKSLLEPAGEAEPAVKGREPAGFSHSPVSAKANPKPEATLTNKHASAPAQPPQKTRKMTADESKQNAARTLQRLLNEKRAAPTA